MSNEAKNLNEQEEQAPELNVVIIAHKKSQFASAASFLGRRGVTSAVRGNIKDGIQYITSQKATLVFLSWNLPNANIVKTYQLLTKTFNVDCVVFAERGDGKTAAELNACKLPEVMQAPVSGPGLYMRIQKILKAKEDLKNGVSDAKTKENYQQNSQDNNKIVLKNSNKEQDDDDGFINLGSNQNQKSGGMINFQSPKYSESDYEESENSDPNANDISAFLDQMSDDPSNDDLPTPHDPHKFGPGTYTQEGIKSKASKAQQDGVHSELNKITQEGLQSDELDTENPEDTNSLDKKSRSHKKEPSYGSVVNVAKKAQANNNKMQYDITKPQEALIQDFKPRTGSKEGESLLAQKTFEAIEKSVRPAYADYTSVEVVSKAKIFNIHTPRFRGYLIFVVPMFTELERSIVSSIKSNLEDLLKAQNEYMLFFEELNIEIEQTDFLKWAQANADFFVQTVDHKTEIICAYYAHNPSLPKLDEEHAKMAKIEIKDLKQDTKTNFNLYIHLPKNNKFVCYMKPGDIITERHKNKFEKNKVNNLHIKKDEVAQFKEYFVSNRLKEIIRKKTE